MLLNEQDACAMWATGSRVTEWFILRGNTMKKFVLATPTTMVETGDIY